MTDDPTQPHAVPTPPSEPLAPTGQTAPTAPATPGAQAATPAADQYSPTPDTRPTWSTTIDAPAATTPERWFEPAPIAPAPAAAVTPSAAGSARKQTGIGSILAVSLLSAVLAAGGTVLVLGATGSLDRGGAFIPTTGQGSNVGTLKPVTIDESSATIDVAAKISPAVVQITVGGTAPDDAGLIPETGVGSGVIYDSDGWILTNHHVVGTSETVQVELKDGRTFTGNVYGIDTLTDLAIVKVDATDLPVAALGDSDALKVGQLVIAIGSPLGTYSNSVTSGIVSAKGRSIETDSGPLNNLIQTDAAINPGNSGGPLLDANGAIVGINTAIATNSNGIGFAIPIDIARPIMEQAVAGEPLSRPYLGINFVSIDRAFADTRDLEATQGALVAGINPDGTIAPGVLDGTPAEEAGIENGDIIVSVDAKVIDEEHPLDATLSQFAPGMTVQVEILRDGQTVTIPVTLATRPANP